ncbi:hypothetical protein D3C73_1630100 [compost metagenome]
MRLDAFIDVQVFDMREVQHMSLAAGMADNRQHSAIGLGQTRLGLARALNRRGSADQHF